MDGDATLFARQDAVEAAWASSSRCSDDVTPVQCTSRGRWGPREADRLAADLGGWDDPLGTPKDP